MCETTCNRTEIVNFLEQNIKLLKSSLNKLSKSINQSIRLCMHKHDGNSTLPSHIEKCKNIRGHSHIDFWFR